MPKTKIKPLDMMNKDDFEMKKNWNTVLLINHRHPIIDPKLIGDNYNTCPKVLTIYGYGGLIHTDTVVQKQISAD